jgi:hypothetical protein
MFVVRAIVLIVPSSSTHRPVSHYWNWFDPEGTCEAEGPPLTAQVMTDVLLNALVFYLPWPTLYSLPLPRFQKIGLSGIFALGLVVILTGCMRAYWAQYIADTTYDVTWHGFHLWAWTAVEVNLGIICGCIPFLQALLLGDDGLPRGRRLKYEAWNGGPHTQTDMERDVSECGSHVITIGTVAGDLYHWRKESQGVDAATQKNIIEILDSTGSDMRQVPMVSAMEVSSFSKTRTILEWNSQTETTLPDYHSHEPYQIYSPYDCSDKEGINSNDRSSQTVGECEMAFNGSDGHYGSQENNHLTTDSYDQSLTELELGDLSLAMMGADMEPECADGFLPAHRPLSPVSMEWDALGIEQRRIY